MVWWWIHRKNCYNDKCGSSGMCYWIAFIAMFLTTWPTDNFNHMRYCCNYSMRLIRSRNRRFTVFWAIFSWFVLWFRCSNLNDSHQRNVAEKFIRFRSPCFLDRIFNRNAYFIRSCNLFASFGNRWFLVLMENNVYVSDHLLNYKIVMLVLCIWLQNP